MPDTAERTLERIEDLMTLDEAIERWPKLKREELLGACRVGDLRHIPKGRARLVTEAWLKDYLARQIKGGVEEQWEGGSETNPRASRSAASGSAGTRTAAGGSETGMTREQEEVGAELLAHAITRKPKKSSPR